MFIVHSDSMLADASFSSSSSFSSFVSVRYTEIKRLSPEWAGVGQRIAVDLGQLNLLVHPRSLLALSAFVLSDLLPMQNAKSQTALSRLTVMKRTQLASGAGPLSSATVTASALSSTSSFFALSSSAAPTNASSDDPETQALAAAQESRAKRQEVLLQLLLDRKQKPQPRTLQTFIDVRAPVFA